MRSSTFVPRSYFLPRLLFSNISQKFLLLVRVFCACADNFPPAESESRSTSSEGKGKIVQVSINILEN